MSGEFKEKLNKFMELQKNLQDLRKQQAEIKKLLVSSEKEIKEYMVQNNMDSISLNGGEIILYGKKIPQTFKKQVILDKLCEKLKDAQKAEELTESIINNKQFIVEDKIKVVVKK